MVLFTSENSDIANHSVDMSFFTSEKNRMANQLASLFIFRVNFHGVSLTWNPCLNRNL